MQTANHWKTQFVPSYLKPRSFATGGKIIGGKVTYIPEPARILTQYNRTFVPFRVVSALLGLDELYYDDNTETIIASDSEFNVSECIALYNALIAS